MVRLIPQILPEGRQLLLAFSDSETQLTRAGAVPYFEHFRDTSPVAKRVGSILIGSLEYADYRNRPLETRLDPEEYADVTREMLFAYYNRSRHLLDQRRSIHPEMPEWLQEKVDKNTVGHPQPKVSYGSIDKIFSISILDKALKGTYALTEDFKYLAETKIEY